MVTKICMGSGLQRCVSRIGGCWPQIFTAARSNGRPRRADRGCEAQGPAGPLHGGKDREEPEHTCPHSATKVRHAGIARRLGGDNPGVALPFMAYRTAPDRSAGKKRALGCHDRTFGRSDQSCRPGRSVSVVCRRIAHVAGCARPLQAKLRKSGAFKEAAR